MFGVPSTLAATPVDTQGFDKQAIQGLQEQNIRGAEVVAAGGVRVGAKRDIKRASVWTQVSDG